MPVSKKAREQIAQETIAQLLGNMAKIPKVDFGRDGKAAGAQKRLVAALAERRMRLPPEAEGVVAEVLVGLLDEQTQQIRRNLQDRGQLLVEKVQEAISPVHAVELLPWDPESEAHDAQD